MGIGNYEGYDDDEYEICAGDFPDDKQKEPQRSYSSLPPGFEGRNLRMVSTTNNEKSVSDAYETIVNQPLPVLRDGEAVQQEIEYLQARHQLITRFIDAIQLYSTEKGVSESLVFKEKTGIENIGYHQWREREVSRVNTQLIILKERPENVGVNLVAGCIRVLKKLGIDEKDIIMSSCSVLIPNGKKIAKRHYSVVFLPTLEKTIFINNKKGAATFVINHVLETPNAWSKSWVMSLKLLNHIESSSPINFYRGKEAVWEDMLEARLMDQTGGERITAACFAVLKKLRQDSIGNVGILNYSSSTYAKHELLPKTPTGMYRFIDGYEPGMKVTVFGKQYPVKSFLMRVWHFRLFLDALVAKNIDQSEPTKITLTELQTAIDQSIRKMVTTIGKLLSTEKFQEAIRNSNKYAARKNSIAPDLREKYDRMPKTCTGFVRFVEWRDDGVRDCSIPKSNIFYRHKVFKAFLKKWVSKNKSKKKVVLVTQQEIEEIEEIIERELG